MCVVLVVQRDGLLLATATTPQDKEIDIPEWPLELQSGMAYFLSHTKRRAG